MLIRCVFICCFVVGMSQPLYAQLEPTSRLSAYVHQYYADKYSLQRKYLLTASTAYYNRMEKLYDRWRNKMSAVNYSDLTVQEAVDFILLRRNIMRDSREERQAGNNFKKIESTIPFRNIIKDIRQQRVVGKDLQGQQFAKQLTKLSRAIVKTKHSLKNGDRLSAAKSRYAIKYAKNLLRTLKEAFNFYDGYDPDVSWWAVKPFKRADSTLTNYITFLGRWKVEQSKEADSSGIVGHPVGPNKLRQLLDYEMIPYSPQKLIAIGKGDYKWSMKQMLKASHQMGYGDDWKAALEHVKNTYVTPGKQPQLIDSLAEEAISFLKENNLITIPKIAEEDWGLRMMSPKRQLINPYFTGGRNITISYPTNTMSQKNKMESMRGNNPYFSRATVHHELIAGHHLEFYYLARYHPYRRHFMTPFWTEGWAVYRELRFWNLGFGKTPEQRVGMLFWRMIRDARIVFSLNYELKNWNAQKCINYLVNNVGLEYANAKAEVRRSFAANYPPLYQAGYLLGAFQIEAMHNELVQKDDMTNKDFNDTFLKNGSMPIEMMRYLLKKEKPPKDFTTHWRFYENLD